jgi:enamine deaminase RidA (YjgF/YER057c/UK114 family)
VTLRGLFSVSLGVWLSASALAQPERPIKKSKEKKEPVTQALEVPPEPPNAIAGETAKLVFHVSPLSAKGLLSQQIRDALKAIDKANGDATLIKLRAFVAGTGDMRRVPAIVSEDAVERKVPLPAVTTIQVGALPLTGAQVVLEAVSQAKIAVNPNGLAFYSAQPAKDIREAVGLLQKAARVMPLLRVTCFLNSLEGIDAARTLVAMTFPAAAANFVQLTRLGMQSLAACEGVGRLQGRRDSALVLQADALYSQPHWSVSASLNTPKIAFSGLQMAFHNEDADVRLAFDRLVKMMEPAGARDRDLFFFSIYGVLRGVEDRSLAARDARFGALLPGPPAGASLMFEGLPSLDAAMGVEAIAAAR